MSDKRTYKQKLLDPRWQKKRLQILERDGWACRFCGDKDKTLHVHHSYYTDDAEGPWDYSDHTLITLCAECHEIEGEELKQYRRAMPGQLAEMGFTTARSLESLLCALDPVVHLSDDELSGLLRGLRTVLDGRFRMLTGDADGAVWNAFVSLSPSHEAD